MKKKIASILAISVIATNSTPALNVFANEVIKEKALAIEEQVSKSMTVSDFKIKNNPNFAKYNELYRVEIQSITNNGRSYPGTKIENAIDGKLNTHWETYTRNTNEFKNEVIVEFKDIAEINRLAYATRQDGAKGKGYPTSAEIYVSESEIGEDFKLAGKIEGSKVTGGMVEFKFDTVRAKRVKFKFVEAHDEWASAAEFWFYKEDRILDKMERLFTNANMNEVSKEFATPEALNTLEKETEGHPFRDSFKEYIDNARLVLENKEVNFIETKVSKLLGYGTENQKAYDDKFMLGKDHIVNTQVNGGTYSTTKIEYMYDGDPNTHWETNRSNGNGFTNEVVFTFDEIEQLDRIALLPRSGNQKGFPTKYEIYASETSQGDTFKLVSSGTAEVTKDFMQFKFNPTNFKRLKFVFKECHENRPFISEARFYKEDALSEKMDKLFTDSNKNTVNPDFGTLEKLTALENEAKAHPLYSKFKEDLDDAKLVLEGNEVTYADAKVSKFKAFGTPELAEYDKTYKIDNSHIKNITTNGRHWSNQTIDKAIDGDPNTNWHSDARNSETHTNEVIMTLDQIRTLDRIVYYSPRDRGFAEKFDIYTSKTSEGDTFTKVTSGSASRTGDSISIKFNPTQARRVKFVYKQGYEGWALASEFGLYKQDQTLDKIQRLFTDDTMSKVSEEFDTVDKLKALENECSTHPFFEDFKEDLYNARVLIEQGKVESSVATSKKFNHLDNAEYVKQFRIPYENIKSISNNAGQYLQQHINNAVDGNVDTYWETNRGNDKEWSNEVTIEFKQPITVGRIAYGARQSDRKGFLEEFEIYGSNATKGDNFQLVATGRADSTSGLVEAKFKPTTFKRMKLKWVKSNQNWATLNEIMFFKRDIVSDKVNNLFTNELKNELNPEFNSLEAIEALEKEVKTHPLKVELMESIDMAKDLIKSPDKNKGHVYELESRGDAIKESQKRKVWNFRDWQPTGLAVKSGEKITVYVDTEPGDPVPNLVFKQMDSRHNGLADIRLTRGKNEITIPEVEVNDIRPGTAKAGVLYASNPYTPEQQARKPKIRIIGGVSYPQFVKGVDNDEQVINELREYTEKLKKDPKLPDVFEVLGDKALVNVRATYALDWYTENNKVPSYTADRSDEVIKEAMKFWGFDGSKDIHSDFNFRYVTMLKNLSGGVFMNAGNGITGYNQGQQGGALNVDTGWGFMHELGHNLDTNNRAMPEITNNILPLHFQMIKGEASKISQQNLWESKIFPKVSKEDYSNNEWYPASDTSSLTHMAPLWQLQLYDNTFWPRFEQQFRERNIGGGDWNNKHEAWAVVASDVLQLDLKEHFARHGFYVNEETAKHMAQYKKPDKKLWYINDNKYLNKGEGFNNEVDCKVKVKTQETSVKLDISIDKTNANSLLGYEIIRDGKVIGFTTKDTFIDTNINPGTNHEYKVVAYDTQLNPSEGVGVKAHQPILETVGGLTLALGENFNALDYVKATDYNGNKLKDIKVTSDVDTTKKGNYTVTYEVTDNDAISKETMNVNVVSKYDYLSDSEWKSEHTDWGKPSRNNSIKGRTLGEIKDYDKGIRLHANGNVVYDLGEHNYDNFEVKVGVDMNLEAQNNSSITFKIVGDGKTLATTKVLKHEDNMQYINVPVKGVKELRLEVNNGGNGNTSDHGIFVEPKLTTNNAKPELTIPKSQTVKVGQTLEDIVGTYKATDAEDGDITGNVVVTGQDKVNFNRVGNYTITYSVTDKDGNKVEKSRVINVINMEDFKYLSDFDWKSANSGWQSVRKDNAVSGNKLKLTGEDGQEVVYDKGIGTHANSTIVYDLTDKNVDLFSAFVGVDRAMYGSVGSVQFEVYVDGEKVYDSGLMNSRDSQKFVDVDLAGAKELKLIAKDGGNGIGSDHATWGDAKLHYVNTERVYTEELTTALEEAKKLDKDNYTDKSYQVLADSIAKAEALLTEEKPNQESIDAMTKELQDNVKGLIEINLQEVVNIPDKYLVKSIQNQLGKTGNITLGDMRSLTTLRLSGVVDLTGIEHARNLETLEMSYNEVKDLRPLANLKKLKTLDAKEQIIAVGELTPSNGKVVVDSKAYNREGKNVAKTVKLVDKDGNTVIEQDAKDESVISIEGLPKGLYGVHVLFEDEDFDGIMIYLFNIN
ncbi:NPCBM/NEW2 domain-containing protein [Romboutsia sp. 1001216sp1]|uniref:NPCBM/NEW2 domain-containing protein n=1 Tax=unclassified Romboutsia TaxID=2626894 RepID=UPI00189E6FB5|nr:MULTISPECIES: NPCBM/NEW2 domain-containing protein [unclassified Romboutsia]MDB8789110.1 NPCBM/NEW2 domain-containing protein [Romboutsia sp. 1001216sp1]MDB8802305.1 NPCBM/NEW2 domain-containing protein [Romboutsia sp. 1001216sp1]MDB8813702.1 NPCBM/NEW2 domain-containing protein [Romboutsia sp. 1001216sp1]